MPGVPAGWGGGVKRSPPKASWSTTQRLESRATGSVSRAFIVAGAKAQRSSMPRP